MKNTKFLFRILSFCLILCFCLTSFAMSPTETESATVEDVREISGDETISASGYNISELTIDNLPDELLEESEGELERAVEIDTEDAETLSAFTLINEDGSKAAFIYEQPIKYIDAEANAIRFIDNSITELDDDIYGFANAANSIDILFPENIEDGVALKAADVLDFSMYPVTDESSSAEYNDNYEFKGITQKVVEYADAFGEGVHLQYSAFASGFKESVVLDEYNRDISSLQFIIKAPGLVPDSETGESISFFDEQTGEFVCIIEPTFIEDSFDGEIDIENPERHISFDNYYAIESLGNYEYLLTSVLDKGFLESETTVYPVMIDPSVTISAGNILSATAHSKAASILLKPIVEVNPTVNTVGIAGDTGTMYSYIKTNAIQNYKYIDPARITSAYYRATEVSGNTYSGDLKIWDTNITTPVENVTYTILANGKSTLTSTTAVGAGNTTYNFPITTLVKAWLSNALGETGFTQDRGFIMEFTPSTQIQIGFKKFGAKGHSTPPSIVINYTEDTTITNGIYYLKNVQSGKYLDVPNGSTTNGTQCVQNSFNGGFSQQWQIKHLGDGTYVLRPMHPVLRSRALEVYTCDATPGAKVDIWQTDVTTPPNYAQWKIVHNNGYPYTPVGGGSYRLMSVCSGLSQSLQVNLSNNCIQNPYTATGRDQWVFEKVTYNYNLLSIMDTVSPSDDFTSIQQNPITPGYKKNTFVFNGGVTTNESTSALENSTVFVSFSHGLANGLYGHYTSEPSITIQSISSSDLSKVRLVTYLACLTGEGGANATNLVNATYNRGARTVIGFTISVYRREAAIWGTPFMAALASGSTITSAMNAADIKVQQQWSPALLTTDNRLVRGIENDDILYYSP